MKIADIKTIQVRLPTRCRVIVTCSYLELDDKNGARTQQDHIRSAQTTRYLILQDNEPFSKRVCEKYKLGWTQSSEHEMDHCHMYPSLRRFGKSFVVLAQPTAPSQPRQRPFNHPSSWQHLKMMTAPRPPHNLQDPTRQGHDPINQLACVTGISPNQSQARKPPHQFVDNQLCPVSILNISRMDYHCQQQSHRIDSDMSLATHHLLTSVIATRPPFSVVLTDWLSMIAALGVGSLPSACRTLGRRASWTRSHVPSSLHARKYHHTVPQGGRSWGMARHVHPLRRTYRMPFTTSRSSTVRGRPPGLAGGSSRPRISHCSSVRSLGYAFLFMH